MLYPAPTALLLIAPCAAALLAACAPALDWRELRPADSGGLQLLMPCKAVAQQRQVVLVGHALRLRLHACDAGDRTWAVAVGDVKDPAQVPAALLALREAAAANVGAIASQPVTLAVPGATPQPDSARVRLAGRRPDGAGVAVETAVFSRGTLVVQATVLGPKVGSGVAEDAEAFFASLRFAP